jgi:TatD DNase family protein
VLSRATQHHVQKIITVGTDVARSLKAVQIARSHPQVFAAVGVHPHNAGDCTPKALERLRDLARDPRVVALGEMGLDFYRNFAPPEQQIHAFRCQIHLARELEKPIIVHDRDAHQPLLKILQEERARDVGGVIHCYSGDLSMAKQCLDMNFFISVPGSITFKNATRLRHVVLNLPLDRLLFETDSPFLAPLPVRGKRNEPSNIRYIAERIAGILKMDLEDLADGVYDNTLQLFRLPMDN